VKREGDVKIESRSESGFTLVEAMIAILILVVGIVAIANLMALAMSSNAVANEGTAAATIATQQLESFKSVQFTALAPGGSTAADVAGFFSDTPVSGVGNIHTRWSIVAVNADFKFISIVSEATAVLGPARTRAAFTTFRACTDPTTGCP
jgi:Tfp pilus assembly protein PilV